MPRCVSLDLSCSGCNLIPEIKLGQVCRAWHTAITQSVTLRYIVWLGIYGKVDGDGEFFPQAAAQRLDSLLCQETAWSSLHFRRLDSFSCHPNDRLRLAGIDAGERSRGIGNQLVMSCDKLPSIISSSGLELGSATYNDDASFEDCFFDADNELLICESR